MKKYILVLSLCICSVIGLAQTPYQSAMKKAMDGFKEGKTLEDYRASTNQFERIAGVEKTEWLPNYWASYAALVAGIQATKDEEKDLQFDKALTLINSINLSNADQSEIAALKGYIALMKISVSPMSRAMSGTAKALEELEKSRKLNPENPRPDYIQGQNTFYTPSFFGGGKEKAKPFLSRAIILYSKEEVNEEYFFLPKWGKSRTESLYKECQ